MLPGWPDSQRCRRAKRGVNKFMNYESDYPASAEYVNIIRSIDRIQVLHRPSAPSNLVGKTRKVAILY